MTFVVGQALTGLAQASSMFLVAAGLSIIFGVTRVVNFAHGAFYMVGAYLAYSLTERLGGAFGFWGGILAAALLVAGLGAAIEVVLLRRLYAAPELFQLLATFGLSLMAEDLVVLAWGPDDLLGRRAPGLAGAIPILGQPFPSYDLFLIALGPAVLGAIWLLFNRTRFGILVRAATQDRAMVAALGHDQRRLFTAVFALGVFLAALGGALQLPRDAVNHTMDLRIVVEAFVVVVIGGLGSIGGAYVAALIVAELDAFGIVAFPGISLVLGFLVMAAVLVLRPHGLFGRPQPVPRATAPASARPWAPLTPRARLASLALTAAAAALPAVLGPYGLAVAAEILVFVVLAASLQLLMSPGGLVSFGHAAPFGLGVYGTALAVKDLGLPLFPALACGIALGLAGSTLVGWFCVRLTGVYFAMLTLAVAQIALSAASQWTAVTGGDNGLLGIWPDGWAAAPGAFYGLCLAAAALAVVLVRIATFSPFGYALRAARDAPRRAEASGIGRARVQWAAFTLAGGLAALAGGLFAFLKGSVFPDAFGVPVSVDGLAMVLLGGVGTVSGAAFGAVVYKGLSIWLVSQTDWSKLVLGAVLVALSALFPAGLGGLWPRAAERGPR